MDGSDFDIGDAIIAGGIVGFVHDSIKSEESLEESDFDPEDFTEAVKDGVESSNNIQLRLLYNENPGLVEFLVKKVREDRENASKTAIENEAAQVRKEMQEELERMEREERDRESE